MFYFSHRVNREVKEIYWETLLANFALALVFIFEPIYLYSISHSFTHVLWFYVQVYAWYAVLICFGANFASKVGYKHSILVSNIFYIGYWISLYFIQAHAALFFIVPIFFALQKSFFWPAYDADISLFDNKKQIGRETAALMSDQQVAFIIAPLIGGFISSQFGFLPLFVSASILIMLSTIPLFRSPDIFDKHEFQFKNLWQVLKTHKANFFGYWGFAEDMMTMSLWPILIYLVVDELSGVGILSAIAMLLSSMLMLYIGKRTDGGNKHHMIEVGSIFYGLTWILRFLAQTTPLVLLFDVLTKTFKGVVGVPVAALTFELAGGKGPDHAIAFAVFYEFSLAAGKVFMCLAAIWILSATGNIYLVFGFAGILTFFYGLLRK